MTSNRQAGFSLIELMISVAILAIVAAIAIPMYQDYIAESRIGRTIKDIRQMELIVNDHFLDNTTTVPLATMVTGSSLNDHWGNAYQYRTPSVGRAESKGQPSNSAPTNYDLFSLGADGAANTGDDIMRGCNGDFVGLAADHPAGASANGC